MGNFTRIKTEAAADIPNIERFIDAEELEAAISAAIEEAIGENGDIETWADARYAPKSNG